MTDTKKVIVINEKNVTLINEIAHRVLMGDSRAPFSGKTYDRTLLLLQGLEVFLIERGVEPPFHVEET